MILAVYHPKTDPQNHRLTRLAHQFAAPVVAIGDDTCGLFDATYPTVDAMMIARPGGILVGTEMAGVVHHSIPYTELPYLVEPIFLIGDLNGTVPTDVLTTAPYVVHVPVRGHHALDTLVVASILLARTRESEYAHV